MLSSMQKQTQKRLEPGFKNYFMFSASSHYSLSDFDLRATHARALLPATLASVSFGFVLVRVRVLCLFDSPEFNVGRAKTAH